MSTSQPPVATAGYGENSNQRRPLRGPSVHDGLSITGFVLAFVLPLIGFILSWVAIAAAHRDGRRTSGLAVAGLVIGGLICLVVVVIVAVAANQPDPTQQWINCLNQQLNNPNLVCPAPGQ